MSTSKNWATAALVSCALLLSGCAALEDMASDFTPSGEEVQQALDLGLAIRLLGHGVREGLVHDRPLAQADRPGEGKADQQGDGDQRAQQCDPASSVLGRCGFGRGPGRSRLQRLRRVGLGLGTLALVGRVIQRAGPPVRLNVE